jgi:hypothetical protein
MSRKRGAPKGAPLKCYVSGLDQLTGLQVVAAVSPAV